VPAGGRFLMTVNGKWDQDNNRTLTIYKNVDMTPGHSAGTSDTQISIGNFRQNSNGTGDLVRDWIVALPVPPSGSVETFYYSWNASLSAGAASTGADFKAIAWKTEAFCNPEG